MKGKQLRKALALIGGFVGSAAMAMGSAHAIWVFATTANSSATASVAVGNNYRDLNLLGSGGLINEWDIGGSIEYINGDDPVYIYFRTDTGLSDTYKIDTLDDWAGEFEWPAMRTPTITLYASAAPQDGSAWPSVEDSLVVTAVNPPNISSFSFYTTPIYKGTTYQGRFTLSDVDSNFVIDHSDEIEIKYYFGPLSSGTSTDFVTCTGLFEGTAMTANFSASSSSTGTNYLRTCVLDTATGKESGWTTQGTYTLASNDPYVSIIVGTPTYSQVGASTWLGTAHFTVSAVNTPSTATLYYYVSTSSTAPAESSFTKANSLWGNSVSYIDLLPGSERPGGVNIYIWAYLSFVGTGISSMYSAVESI